MTHVGAAGGLPSIPHHVPVDADGFLIQDVKCRRCTYNLRGLKADGLCPECGVAVGLSTQGDYLRFADPSWLETIHRGTRLILWGILVSMLAGCAAQGISRSTGSTVIGEFVQLIGGLFAAWGTWLLTEPDPSGVGEDKWARTRRFVRFSIVAGLVGGLISIIIEVAHLPPIIDMLVAILGFGMILLGAIGFIAEFLYLGSLAGRIPNEGLAGRCRFLAWSVGVCGIGAAVGGILMLVGLAGAAPGTPPGLLTTIGGIVAAISGVLYAILSLISLFTINRFRKELASLINLARETYAAAGGIPTARAV